jgi:hypothetical protein
MIEEQKCPNCTSVLFYEGPHGGASVNVMCAKCKRTFNWMGPFGLQPIEEVPGVYHQERARTLRTFMNGTQALISLGVRIEQLERENQECKRIIAMDTATVNTLADAMQQKAARIEELEQAVAGWHSPSFIQMYMGYMTGKLHLEHIGKKALLDCFEEFEAMMEKQRDA